MIRLISTALSSVVAGLVPAIHALLAAHNVPAAVERKTWMPGPRPGMTSVLIAIAWLLGVTCASAQQRPNRLEIWDLKLGMSVNDLPDEFTDYACGNNGGPPSTALTGWKDFKRCRPEPGGLREVYFRYDDELEYWAKANQFATAIRKFSGTKVFDFPVVLSARFDDDGILKGIRIVSDPRDTSRDREEAYLLRNFLNAR